MSILLAEALARYAGLCRRAGISAPRQLRRTKVVNQQILALTEKLAPLLLPDELVTFWQTWDTESFVGLHRADAALFSPADATELWPLEVDQEPRILLPFMRDQGRTWTMELATDDHPGGRVIWIDYRDRPRTLAVGLSHVLERLCDSMEISLRAGLSPRSDEFDWVPRWAHRASLSAELNQEGTDFFDKCSWPPHWLEVQGIDVADLQLKGRTHSIWGFDTAREQQSETRATLRGTFRVHVGGGSLNGDLGVLRDHTGSIQVLVPFSALILSRLRGAVEMDVVARPQLSTGANSIPHSTTGEITDVPRADGSIDRMVHDIFNAITDLDVSVVATAVRPLR